MKRSKNDVLADVGTLVQDGTLTFDDLQKVYNFNAPDSKHVSPSAAASPKAAEPERRAKALGNVLYIVGTLIVCIGIAMLIGQNWQQMNTVMRIASTVGLGLAVLAGAIYRAKRQTLQVVNSDLLTGSLFTIASVALGIGAGVVVTELGGPLSEPGSVTGVALMTSGVFLALYLQVVRTAVLLAAAIVAAVLAYFSGIEWLTVDWAKSTLFYCLETACAGALLVAGGLLCSKRVIAAMLTNLLYGIGWLLTLGSFFWLTIAGNNDYLFGTHTTFQFDALYPLILAVGVLLSVLLRSRHVLVLTAVFLTCYLFEISAEYFSEYLGGSVALCLAGVLVMGMAYAATRFAKRYIHSGAKL